MIFITESGSAYEMRGSKVQRVNLDVPLRADGEWVNLHNDPEIVLGSSVVLMLESLSSYGPDSYGNEVDSLITTRITSPVSKIYETMDLYLEDTQRIAERRKVEPIERD